MEARVKGRWPTLMAAIIIVVNLINGSHGKGVPMLLVDPPADDPTISRLGRATPLASLVVSTATEPVAAGDPVELAFVDTKLLLSNPKRLTLQLPNVKAPVIAIREDRISAAPVTNASCATGGFLNGACLWVGRVRGAAGKASSVTLEVGASGGVYGSLTMWHNGAQREYAIAPARGAIEETPDGQARAAHPEARILHTVVEAANDPPACQAGSAKTQAAMASALPVEEAVDTTPPGGMFVVGNSSLSSLPALNLSSAPLSMPWGPEDAESSQRLAAAAAASAGPIDAPHGVLLPTSPPAEASAVATTASDAGAVRARRKLLQSRDVVTHILIIYTTRARQAAGGTEPMLSTIRATVAQTNQAYTSSGVRLTLSILDIREASGYSDAGKTMGNVLGDAQAGRIPNVHSWRNQLRADMVAVFADTTDGAGLAYVVREASRDWMYSVMARSGWSGRVLAHELGHNHGCVHDFDPNETGVQPYSFGIRRCNLGSNSFYTIMSYGHIDGTCSRVSAQGLMQFSDPTRSYRGSTTGDARTANCARTHRETAEGVSRIFDNGVNPPVGGSAVRSRQTSNCVDAPTYNDGVRLYTHRCHSGGNQRWTLQGDGSLRVAGFTGGSKCMDVASAGTGNGVAVNLWGCTGANHQKWFLDWWGRLHPYHAPTKCLDLPSTANGAGLTTFDCHMNSNQQWDVEPKYSVWAPVNQGIKSRLNNMCIDVFAFDYRNGAPVVMWPCNTATNQQWITDSWGRLLSTHNTKKCLDASSNSRGSAVYIFDCHSQLNQRWFQDSLGRLRPAHAVNMCLDITGANRNSGARLQLWDCVDVPQQKWFL